MNNLVGRCLQMKSSGSPPPQHWLELLGKSHFYQRDKQQIMTWQQQLPCPLSAFDMHLVYTNSYDLFEKNHCHFIKTNRDFMKTPYKPKSISQYDKFKAFF